jgi:DNA-binding response OmpR family regulator
VVESADPSSSDATCAALFATDPHAAVTAKQATAREPMIPCRFMRRMSRIGAEKHLSAPETVLSDRARDGRSRRHHVDVRVLVVEDEVALADTIARGLTAEGFAVEVTHDGADALWRARERSYSAIVLDLLLPGMNGFEVCRTLRAEEIWTPILVLTAKTGEWDEAEALDTGADDYLSKPFSFVVLVARLRALVRRGATPRSALLSVGTLVLDPFTHTCHRRGVDVHLTPRECGLLAALLRRDGGVVSKRELLDEVWGSEFSGDPNIVEVYVRYLRRKIDLPFGLDTIETVRHVGYRMVSDAA